MRNSRSYGGAGRFAWASLSVTCATLACVFLAWWFALRFELVPRTYVPGIAEIVGGFETFLAPNRSRDAFSYFAFPEGRGFWLAYGLTAARVSVALCIGGILGVAFGALSGAVPAMLQASTMWMIFWHDVVPRLLMILYITSLGITGTPAAVVVAGLSVFCIVGLTTMVAVQDPELREQIESARLETASTYQIMLTIVLPQKASIIAIAWSLGATSALSLVYFVEYVQSARGLGYYLQIAFSSDAKIPEAIAVTGFGLGIVALWVGIIMLLAHNATHLCMRIARLH